MNGGATLVTTVMLLSDPMGLVGVFTYNISSRAMGWYYRIVSPPMVDLRFVSDTQVVIAGESNVFHLNVDTGELNVTTTPENIDVSFTTNYERYICSTYTLNQDGTSTYALYVDDVGEPFFSATDGDTTMMPRGTKDSQTFSLVAQPSGITETCFILTLRQEDEDAWYLARWA